MENSKRDNFISQSIVKHGNKYDYSKVVYIGSLFKVTIVCTIHGDFQMLPHNHLRGSGCPKCGIGKIKNKLTRTNEEFITDCKRILGDNYSFEKTHYVYSKKRIIITCKKHGDFSKIEDIRNISNQIYTGNGCCPKCKEEQSQEKRSNYLLKRLKNYIITNILTKELDIRIIQLKSK